MNFIKKIIENLKDPKKKSITLLVIYIIFFIIVFALINSRDSVDYNNDYSKEENETSTIKALSYDYIYRIYDNENIVEIKGTYKDNINSFVYKGINYIKKNNIVYLDSVPTEIDFDVDKYKYDVIELLLENSDSQTTYKESKKVVYNINLSKYFELVNENNNCYNIDCNIISIPITIEKDEYSDSVLIDLSNYYEYKYNIELNYSI